MTQTTEEWMQWVAQVQRPDLPLYMLVDPLKAVYAQEEISVPALYARVSGERKAGGEPMATVMRPDLSHTPEHCPHLVRLRDAGEPMDEEIAQKVFSYAIYYARHENPAARRYVCGWLQSALGTQELAQSLAERMVMPWKGRPRVFAVHEPLQQELIAATAEGDTHARWLGDVAQWVIPTSWQGFLKLGGATGGAAQLDENTLLALADTAVVAHVLSVWYKQTTQTMTREQLLDQPYLTRGQFALPENAAAQALAYLRQAQRRGIKDQYDFIVYAIMHLTAHPEFDRHPYVRDAIDCAARGQGSFTDRLAVLSHAQWQMVLKELRG